jgi:hypothetical protein
MQTVRGIPTMSHHHEQANLLRNGESVTYAMRAPLPLANNE